MSRVLLVDDDANLREALVALMTAEGYDVTVANDGLEALGAALMDIPQVIVSDIHMPALEGTDLVRMLKAIPRLSCVPIILMSGVDTEASVPVEHILKKPFDPAVLLEFVSQVTAHLGDTPIEALYREPEHHPAQALFPGPQISASAEACAARVRRGLELVHEQAARVDLLRNSGTDVSLAEQSYEVLVACVAALVRLEMMATAAPILFSATSQATGGRGDSQVSESGRKRSPGHSS
ncbi:PleD family two-component system response regulator [Paraburkholderia phymatum]|uniref:PleD family two-component system response regulator n=1 Tax=Paraburkholderia phymatum TaxID=148447 RepID=A0ACC6U889_9BURK